MGGRPEHFHAIKAGRDGNERGNPCRGVWHPIAAVDPFSEQAFASGWTLSDDPICDSKDEPSRHSRHYVDYRKTIGRTLLGLLRNRVRIWRKPDDKFVVILGDNLFESDLGKYIEAFVNHQYSSMVLLKEVDDPSRYGVPILDGDRIRMIEEKPTDPKSNYCVTGIYFYNGDVFDVIRTIKPSERGELEITDVNNRYAAMNRLAYRILDGWWTDAGTFSSLLEANERLSQGRK